MTFQSHAVYDNETEIIRAGNTPCPADVDLKLWQKRIDQVAGKTATNQSRLRIVWGQDRDATKMIVCGEWRLKYPFWRLEEEGKIVDIGVPRFFVEEHIPRADLMIGGKWAQARYHVDPSTREMIDVLGDCPEDGFYSRAFVIAHHDEMCCGGAELKNGEPCYGAYRPPTQTDIDRIQRALQRREKAQNSEAAPTPEQIEKKRQDVVLARDERRRRELRERLEDWTKTHAHTWTTHDPSVISNGKFHFLSGHSKSGAPTNKEQNADSTGSSPE